MRQRDLRKHYDGLAAEYDEHWFYGPEYIPWMSGRIAEALRLSAANRIADIGSGTCLFTREVARQLRPLQPILCIDPSEAMLRGLGTPPPPALMPVVASAEDIAERRASLPYEQFDAMWLKESVHHVTDPARTLRGLAERLASGGRLLVIMLPATIQYPLFTAALARFEELQPDPAVVQGHLSDAGLETRLEHVEHELRIDRDKYLGMVRARYMSVLSTFSEGEIEEGIDEMRAAHPEPVLVFPDRFAFILGRRPKESA
ncbi:class I SAM-dependent methyltransferase [Streptomyces seoulensis]|uniref:class I SAM-dependent methyltransferase n=1 Tax=Streptomyces seoulensis TaxID=73044 RepID=UPI001FCC41A2|nr:class I SAM-dependent methyltransferase [Streptomyces seoulensis]